MLIAAIPACAHTLQVEPVLVQIRPQKTFLTVELDGNGEDIIQAVHVRDEERVGNVDFVPAVQQRLQAYINQKLILKQGEQTLSGQILSLEYWRPDDFDYTKSKFALKLRYPRETRFANEHFVVHNNLFDYLPNAKAILWVSGVQKTLSPGQTAEIDPAAVTANLLSNIRDFAVLGAEHIFTGPDHVLFVLALLLVSNSFSSLVKTLSGFTLAQSITLVLATLGVVAPPARLVDIIVAASIIYVGLENVYAKEFKHRFWVASSLGLIHGFAFAGNLRDIGLPEEGLVWCLLSFNLGVEIGQVIICALAYPVTMHFKHKLQENAELGGSWDWPRSTKLASWFVVAAGAYWMVQRAFS
jgi:hydrogenase/urease accessory protein HupE